MKPSKRKTTATKQELTPGESFLYTYEAPVSRERFLSLSREYLSILKKSLVEFRGEATKGKSYVQAYSRIVDAIVGVLFQRAIQEHGLPNDEPGLAVIGLGGYGRGELAPYSDVDILVLCKRKTRDVKRIAESFIQLMWDVGFELGHSVQSLVESESAFFKHMDARTALSESRWICGSESIAREAERRIWKWRQRDRRAFLKRKIRDATVRHEKYGDSYQLIEPNVKLSPGGLRDFHTLVWLGMVAAEDKGLPALREKGLLLQGEVEALERAYDFILKVRVELHICSKSKQDQLTVRMQRRITERLGYRDKGGHLAVELFMKDYYDHSRTIYLITRDIIEELEFGENTGILIGRGKKSEETKRLTLRVDRKKIKQEPLYVFVRQKAIGLRLDRSVKRRLKELLETDLAGRAERSRMRRDFPELLHDGKNVSLILRAMHETGFLGVVIPEYKFLTSLKRYDLYHHYTVDEHSFQVVRNLEDLAESRSRRIQPFARIYSEIADKQALFLAALLHDIGKIQGHGHAKKGASLSRKILKRMSVKTAQVEGVSFLIDVHLLMAHFSQRRDPTDIGMLQSFCSRVRTRPNLKLLCLLTYADLKATSPHAWTEWKRTLLWGLYLKAYQFMATKEKKPEAFYKARKKAILRGFKAGEERERALAHLDKLPGRYLLTMSVSQVRRHLALIENLDGSRAVVGRRRGRLATEISFCTIDKPYRLSQLCGVLTLNDCNILFANAFTRSDGIVVDVFHVEDISGTMPVDKERTDKIRADLDDVLKGRLNIHTAVEKHIAKWKRKKQTKIPIPLKIEFHNDISGDVTIVDIFAPDQPGLLFKITRALSDEGLTIHRARISTEAQRAIDSFDFQDKNGKKINSAVRLRKIRTRLEKELV
ncbi:MAG: [protein-PII] uridylyltransferase [Candidatus Latescibacterota bacterium]|nr:MAG: [protein-PII] uridylyltransferase [Candidatus Latescibacterota bacterium]